MSPMNKLTRQELYELAWTAPMSKLADRFGLSGPGLKKICDRHQIPTPGRGYWQKVRHGKRVRKKPLPDLPEGEESRPIQLGSPSTETASSDQLADLSGPVADQRRIENQKENKISVPDHLRGSHPLIRETREAWKAGRSRRGRTCRSRSRPVLNIRVSKDSQRRVLLIMNALLNALEKRDFPLRIANEKSKSPTVVTVHGEDVEFCLEERRKQVERTADEIERTVFSWEEERTFYDLEYTGRLTLKIESWQARGGRRSWTDGKIQRIENCLNDFIVALVRTSESIKEWKRRHAEQERQRELKRERRLEEQRKQELKQKRVEAIQSQIEAWRLSQDIRLYSEAYGQAMDNAQNLSSGPDLNSDQWLAWMLRYADEIDPFS